MPYRAPDEDEARAILDAMEASEENLGPGRGQLVYSIDKKDGTNARGFMVSITEPSGGFTLGDDLAGNRHAEVQYGDVERITILGYE
jgi:hypothetical protein